MKYEGSFYEIIISISSPQFLCLFTFTIIKVETHYNKILP